MRAVHEARFFFDAGSGGVLWMDELAASEAWENPVDLDRLPISDLLRDDLMSLVEWYDRSLNWDYPPDPGPWREAECDRFNRAVHDAFDRLRDELGPRWQITNRYEDLHEDPDLDRYLTDPTAFRR